MFSRLGQLTRHVATSIGPLFLHRAAVFPSCSACPMATAASRQQRPISTAACLVIGDEVLGGKTVDTNSAFFAKYCFSLGISLKRIEVIADDANEIGEAVQRMSAQYDFVVTSGGIGPTHDDITYQSIGQAFNLLPLTLHQESFARMKRLSRPHAQQPNFSWDMPSAALTAKKRMVELPLDSNARDADQVVFTNDKLWVPLCIVNGNVHILPGVPRLFQQILDGYRPSLQRRLADPAARAVYRIIISTPLPESEVAGPLTEWAKKLAGRDLKLGSYPRWGKKRNIVTLVGKDREYMDSLVPALEQAVRGRRVAVEGEDDTDAEE